MAAGVGLFMIIAAGSRVAAGCQSGECTGVGIAMVFAAVIRLFSLAVTGAALVMRA